MAELTMDGAMTGWIPALRRRDHIADEYLIDVRHPAVSASWVTVAEAAGATGVASGTIRQWYRNGQVRMQRRDGRSGPYMVSLDDVVGQTKKASPPRPSGTPKPKPEPTPEPDDVDAAYWQGEAVRARGEAELTKADAEQARKDAEMAWAEADRANARVRQLTAESASLRAQIERLEAEVEEAGRPDIHLPGYRGPVRAQDPYSFQDENEYDEAQPETDWSGYDSENVYPGSDKDDIIDLKEAEAASNLRPALYNDDMLPADAPSGRRRRH